jgi:hypothetical protein
MRGWGEPPAGMVREDEHAIAECLQELAVGIEF